MKASANTGEGPPPKNAWPWIFAVGLAAVTGFFLGRSDIGQVDSLPSPGAPEKAVTSAPIPSSSLGSVRPQAVVNSPVVTTSAVSEKRWSALRAEPDTPERDRALAVEIETLAHSDPVRALALAQAEPSWRLRDLLRNAALRGWAALAPASAGEWVLRLRPEERRSAVEAVLEGAAAAPEEAIRLGARLCETDPMSATEYGQMTVAALGRSGNYVAAARFAASQGASQGVLLTTAYAQWAERDPDGALGMLRTINDPDLRRSAFEGLTNGWAGADPAGLAEHAQQLALKEDRSAALSLALSRWVERDPIAATTWIKANDPGSDADDGISSVANLSSLVETNPETALQWSDLIMDPQKRTLARQSILARWAARDPIGARHFAESLSIPEERAAAIAALGISNPDSN
jgi:hypothetical protein